MASDVTVDLVRSLVQNLKYGPEDWTALSLVLQFPDGQFNSASGYVYLADGGIKPVVSDAWAVEPAVKAYTDHYYKDGEALPVSLLVQYDRSLGRYKVTFEDTDESRWRVTPVNITTLPEELRPEFS